MPCKAWVMKPCASAGLPSLLRRLAAGESWDLVFNIAEGMGGFGREAQVPAVLEYYGIPYTFSDPLTLSLSLHKGMAKRVVARSGSGHAGFCGGGEPGAGPAPGHGFPPVRQAGGQKGPAGAWTPNPW